MRKLISILIVGLVILVGVGFAAKETLFPMKDKGAIEKYAKEYDVKPELISAFINFETGFEPVEYKEGKACGLMKLTAKTGENLAKEIGDNNFKAKDIADNDINIKLGTYYLSKSVKDGLKETVGNWAIRNGEEKNDKFDAKEYAKEYFTKKIELREKIYKILYFTF
ncbi:lytic transglycosylase domain-containing protein [Clostridium baratii]|uniref:transglycosylase SLT domain-containing protein n=1 Tax=Clostridium baratii TaxID=1561 RepID=UPI00097FAD61|nr:transglycosylase SLT domain-containing protein [Clostridium baratii]AQM60045.1 hypothetical protein NPD11_760 [Clostridium baratii]MBS6041836.1 transglycosylase SLT domain-containing protein [Clostridium baratii]STB00015.1 lytic murein transglycosylase [Clostridium baratii]